jgi:hypothetical protein
VGFGFSLRWGEAVTSWLDLGLAAAMASTTGEPEHAYTFGRFGPLTQLYVSHRWFIQAGFGVSAASGADPEDLAAKRRRYGEVYVTGLGTHLYLTSAARSGGWLLSPVLSYEIGPDRHLTTTALWLGLEVSWWSGLPRSQLELPIEQAYE